MGEAALALSDRRRLAHLTRSSRQHEVLIRLARTHGWIAGAEIGVLRGKTLFLLLDAVPALSMYGVDQWQQLPLRADENAETYVDFDMEKLRRDVCRRAADYGTRCRILDGDSATMAVQVPDGVLDFVFIDGDHTERGVERDIRAWAPKVKVSGKLLGHDSDWPTVRRVIDRCCPGWTDYGEAVWGVSIAEVRL